MSHPHVSGSATSTSSTGGVARVGGRGLVTNEHVVRAPSETSHPMPQGCFWSRKVFVGGLDVGCPQHLLLNFFRIFGKVTVLQPRDYAIEVGRGFAYMFFEKEESVFNLMSTVECAEGRFYHYMPLPCGGYQRIQVNPFRIHDSLYSPVGLTDQLDQTSVFLCGVPSRCSARKLAEVLGSVFGDVVFSRLYLDPHWHYPRGYAVVSFSDVDGFKNAVKIQSIGVQSGGSRKKVNITPFLKNQQKCALCEQVGRYYCTDLECLKYHCVKCWHKVHTGPRSGHKSLSKPLPY